MSVNEGYVPNKFFTDLFPETTGNAVNGHGEPEVRQPSPFFWHPADRHEFGELQREVVGYHRRAEEITQHYTPDAPRGPKAVERADTVIEKSAEDWSAAVKEFTMAHEGDLVGITPMDPLYVYDGYEVDEPWVIIVGVAMDHALLNQAPASVENPAAGVEVAAQYNRAARVCRELTNYILGQGYHAKAWAGPFASALSMMPAAIQSGIGELGKHGSLINGTYGSSIRLSAVTTDMPLMADNPVDIGAEDFCASCQVCTNACPPDAIYEEKQMVRGVEKWFVDFNKCIPYFGETLGCAICVARCPWSRPGTAPKLAAKMLARRASKEKRNDG